MKDKNQSNWEVCVDCTLKGKRVVVGRGNPEADIWFVGEAPGEQEEATGKPFVGSAGKILQETIDKIGLEEGSYYVTNIVRCRPTDSRGKNRPPTDDEKSKCSDLLIEDMDKYKPRFIVTLGAHATKDLVSDEETMMNLAGNLIEDKDWVLLGEQGRWYYPMIHPAATLYNPSLRTRWELDSIKLREAIDRFIVNKLMGGREPADDE